MKVIDFFGFGHIPVIARQFRALDELVISSSSSSSENSDKNGSKKVNGYVFDSEEKLVKILSEEIITLRGHNRDNGPLHTSDWRKELEYKNMVRNIVEGFCSVTWEQHWEEELYYGKYYCKKNQVVSQNQKSSQGQTTVTQKTSSVKKRNVSGRTATAAAVTT